MDIIIDKTVFLYADELLSETKKKGDIANYSY